jgi:activating signal cointegrator 1
LRGLTVPHPYAQAIACGLKRIETRKRRTRYCGRLAIQAALVPPLSLAVADLDKVLADCRASGVDTGAVRASLEAPESWALGKIIALAELADCVPVEELAPDPVERAFGYYAPARFGWRLAGVVRLPVPIAARGLQGLWPMKPEVMNILVKALSHSAQAGRELDGAFQVRDHCSPDMPAP